MDVWILLRSAANLMEVYLFKFRKICQNHKLRVCGEAAHSQFVNI
jgi:hypothetical protein